MEIEELNRFEGKNIKIILTSGWIYTNIVFRITINGSIEFKDRSGEIILVKPGFIEVISKSVGGKDD